MKLFAEFMPLMVTQAAGHSEPAEGAEAGAAVLDPGFGRGLAPLALKEPIRTVMNPALGRPSSAQTADASRPATANARTHPPCQPTTGEGPHA